MTPARRAEVALLVADGLAEIHKKEPSRIAAELAILYEIGRNFERAAGCFLQAARNAAAVYANHEAGELCGRAISVAGRLPDAQRSALVLDAAMLRAELHLNVSDFESAVADFGIAEKTASDAGLVEAQIDAVCGAALALFNIKRTAETRARQKRWNLRVVRAAEPVASSKWCSRWNGCAWAILKRRRISADLRCRYCRATPDIRCPCM